MLKRSELFSGIGLNYDFELRTSWPTLDMIKISQSSHDFTEINKHNENSHRSFDFTFHIYI